MAFGFESGITSFFVRRQDFFKGINIEGSFSERIQDLKSKIKAKSHHKPTIVILGAGPAGLFRAIQSISNGNPTTVIERRSEDAAGRINTVALTATTIQMLQYCGIYQYLMEKGLIYPPNRSGYICVRLADLELAMKEVLNRLGGSIQYDSKISKIDSQSDKINLNVESLKGVKTLSGIDILVNAEGSRSTTNALLGIGRTEVLPPIPVIAAIFKDNRPKIVGIGSLLSYAGKSVLDVALTIHYHIQFIFKFVISSNFRRQITGALILKTPKQIYVGCGFSDEINNRLLSLKEAVAKKKGAEEEYQAFAKQWINHSICLANLVALIQFFCRGPHLYMGCHRSLESFEVIKIGADRANEYCKSIGKTAVLETGDAGATVDPTTGLGCNTAIQSAVDFLDFIWDYDAKIPQKTLLKDYANRMEDRVEYIHEASKISRSLYRHDSLVPQSMFMAQRGSGS